MGRKKQIPEESAKHALILKTAGKMFMREGFGAVSMDALADAVPVSKRTLYNHFKDKKALFTAVMQSRCGIIFTQLEASMQGKGTPDEALSAIGMQFLDAVLHADSINIYRAAIMQAYQFPELGKLFYESGPKRSVGIVTRYLEGLNKKKTLKIKNPELAAGIFLNMLSGRAQMRCMLGVRKSITRAEKEEIVAYVVQVFLHGQNYL